MIPDTSSREVKSVRTAFRIIDILRDYDGVDLNELAERLGLAKSTVHNYLSTLRGLGYVVERDGSYRLGLRFLTEGMVAQSSLRMRPAVAKHLAAVAEAVGQPTWWVVEEHGRGIFVESAMPPEARRIYGRVGKRSYLHTHAPGKAILAAHPDEYLDAVADFHGLPEHTERTRTDTETLQQENELARQRGFAVADGEAALGVRSAGVAFEGPSGYVHGIGVFGYSHDFGLSEQSDISEALLDAANALAADERPSDGTEGS